MPESGEFRSALDAAEQAAAAGDYASAEELLRNAALLQEASLGPLHPDLANTLNNLGVVCEITEKPVDAEHCFRRACAIAAAALEPDHPFVARSRKNLEDFCKARGKPVDPPTAPPAVASDPSWSQVASRRWSRPLAIGALIAGAMFVTFIGATTWLRSNHEVASSPGGPSGSPPARPATTTAAAPPPANPTATKPAGRQAPKPVSVPPAPKTRSTASAVTRPPLVATARICKNLSTSGPRDSSGDWRCVPPGLPVGPGSLYFYTRLKSPTDTTVQHLWYRGDRLRQVVQLRVRANTTAGYRTYSRNTVDDQRAAEWRVELRTRGGVLLHEERFRVR